MTYAQFGEDLLLEVLFEQIGTTNQWCCEVGAADGQYLSNTRLFRERGWTAVLGESDPGRFDALKENCPTDHLFMESVTDMDKMLAKFGAPTDIDLVVIDVDGEDYWLWYDMVQYRPRVMLIEFNPYVQMDTYDPVNVIPRGGPGQTAEAPLVELATQRGYTLQGKTFCNLLFSIDTPSGSS